MMSWKLMIMKSQPSLESRSDKPDRRMWTQPLRVQRTPLGHRVRMTRSGNSSKLQDAEKQHKNKTRKNQTKKRLYDTGTSSDGSRAPRRERGGAQGEQNENERENAQGDKHDKERKEADHNLNEPPYNDAHRPQCVLCAHRQTCATEPRSGFQVAVPMSATMLLLLPDPQRRPRWPVSWVSI